MIKKGYLMPKSMEIDKMFAVHIGFDVLKTTRSAKEIVPYVYDADTAGTKMPGSKRYVVTVYLPMPDEIVPDRVMHERDIKEV